MKPISCKSLVYQKYHNRMKKYVQFFALKNSGNVVGIMSEFAKKNSYFLIIFTIFATFDERFSFWFNLTTTWLENPDFGSKSRF